MSGSKSPVYIGAGSDELAVSSALTIIANSAIMAQHVVTTQRFATLTGSTVTNEETGVDTNKYSALEYAQGSTAGTGGSAKNWATQTAADVTGASTGDMSAKEWAIGELGRGQSGEGSAKDWATRTGATVDNAGYSAREYSDGVTASTGSSKQWALGGGNFVEATAVTGSNYSAKKYASDAQTAKTGAETAKTGAETAKTGAETAKTAAETAKTAAETAKAAVDSTFDNFDDRFLGTFTTANEPTVDNDNDALSVGAVYYNSTVSQVRFYNGSTWDAPAASAATSATTAGSSATAAASSATAAASSATAASSSASTATSAKTSAENSMLLAEDALEEFQELYHGASTTTPSTNVTDGDLWFDTNTGVNALKVYNLSATAWEAVNISALNQTQVNTLTTGYDGTTSTSGTNLNIAQVDVVADNIANVNKVGVIDTDVTKVAALGTNGADVTTVAGIGTNGADVTTVAGKATEVGLLGTSAMATASTGHLALLGTTAMANTSNGYLKVLGNSTVTDDMAILGSTTVTDDMALLAISDVIDDMETCANNIADVNNFADLYQIHNFSSDPTTDGGGNTVAEGDLAYDSTSNTLKYYTGSSWAAAGGITLSQVQTEANNAAVAMSIALG